VDGDSIIASAWPQGKSSPLAMFNRIADGYVAAHHCSYLKSASPESILTIGPIKPGHAPTCDVHVLCEKAGYLKHAVRLSRVLDGVQPTVIRPNGGDGVTTGSVVVNLVHAGEPMRLPGASIAIQWARDNVTFRREGRLGESLVVPSGIAYVIPAGELATSTFKSLQIDVRADQHNVVAIAMDSPLYRYRIRAELPDGAAPSEFGVGYKTVMDASGPQAEVHTGRNCPGGTFEFITVAQALSVSLYAKGLPPMKVTIGHGQGTLLDGAEELVFRFVK
jgi:hypothetical protein